MDETRRPLADPRNTRKSAVVLTLGMAAFVGGCGATPREQALQDPSAALRDQQVSPQLKREAVDKLWEQRPSEPELARETLKRVIWQVGAGSAARVRAIELLVEEPTDAAKGHADTRNLLRLLLPTDPDPTVIAFIAELAANRGWRDLSPALIRAWAKKMVIVPDRERSEAIAVQRLNPGVSVEQAVFGVFAAEISGQGREREWKLRARRDAWEVLTRLDADGSVRTAMLAQDTPGTDRAALELLRACAKELRSIPLSSSQLEWAERLGAWRTPGAGNSASTGAGASSAGGGGSNSVGAANAAWWREVVGVLDRLPSDRSGPLLMRHLEPIRWAAVNQPEWLAADRAALLRLADERARTWRVWRRAARTDGARETFAQHSERLSWGDLLTLLVLDAALRQPGAADALLAQADADRADTSSEHGGAAVFDGAGCKWVDFPARATQRGDDTRYVAPPDLFVALDRGLAHYHFHAQKVENADNAGPGPGDMEFAREHGRTCLVFTSVRKGVLNVDYYDAAGVIIDLGELRATPAGKE